MVDGLFDDFKDKIIYEIEKTREWVHSNSNKIDRLKANKSKLKNKSINFSLINKKKKMIYSFFLEKNKYFLLTFF
jgi:hypothetical protein